MNARELFTVVLRPEPNVAGLRALRALLKIALRAYGLRCLKIEIALPDDPPVLEQSTKLRVADEVLTHSKGSYGNE